MYVDISPFHYAAPQLFYTTSNADISTSYYVHLASMFDANLLTCHHAVPTAFGYLMLRRVGWAVCPTKIGFASRALLLFRHVVLQPS